MTEHSVRTHTDLRKLVTMVSTKTQRVIMRVALGLNVVPHATAQSIDLPDTFFQVRIAKVAEGTDEQAKEFLRDWILRNGFRDLAENVAAVLDEIYSVVALWTLPSRAEPDGRIKSEVWNELVVEGDRKFKQLGVAKKLTKLAGMGLDLDETLVKQVLSINDARNCLVHRKGIVSEADARDNGALVLRWTRLVIVARDEDGDRELRGGMRVERGTEIAVKHVTGSASFAVGERLRFSTEQFAEIAWTLVIFAESARASLTALGRARGIPFTDQEPEGTTERDAAACEDE